MGFLKKLGRGIGSIFGITQAHDQNKAMQQQQSLAQQQYAADLARAEQQRLNNPLSYLSAGQKSANAQNMFNRANESPSAYAAKLSPFMRDQDSSYVNRLMEGIRNQHVGRFSGGGSSGSAGPTAVLMGNQNHQLRTRDAQRQLGLLQQGYGNQTQAIAQLNNQQGTYNNIQYPNTGNIGQMMFDSQVARNQSKNNIVQSFGNVFGGGGSFGGGDIRRMFGGTPGYNPGSQLGYGSGASRKNLSGVSSNGYLRAGTLGYN